MFNHSIHHLNDKYHAITRSHDPQYKITITVIIIGTIIIIIGPKPKVVNPRVKILNWKIHFLSCIIWKVSICSFRNCVRLSIRSLGFPVVHLWIMESALKARRDGILKNLIYTKTKIHSRNIEVFLDSSCIGQFYHTHFVWYRPL